MSYIIRRVKPEELEEALALVLKTFMEFEAPVYPEEGIANFKKDVIDNEEFKEACRNGVNKMWGAFDQQKLVGVITMRGESHICLVFMDRDYHRKGIASSIFQVMVNELKAENPSLSKITVNSSPYGVPFYHKIGFTDTDVQQTMNGITFTPMVYSIK